MYDSEFEDITTPELKQFIKSHKEKEYLIVDVRQPDEYTKGHIPGAKFIPLNKLLSDFSGLPADRDVIFYCHSGGRSVATASMFSEEGITEKTIYNLEGGILSWESKALKGFPKIQFFDKTKEPVELLLTAMDLEKGAWRFYTYILKNFAVDPIIPTLEQLSKAEIAHARTVYGFWEKASSTPMVFDQLYESLKGEILEGGESLANTLAYLEDIEENACLRIIELAIHMEYAAFDLYKTMAEQEKDQTVRDSFLSIAQAEKSHMRILARALDQCV
ncbi:MAG: sulfurtransferase [Deltaproteobacteria bacterium]|nr:sulfurtransferase [Deltaproteobacteria bacterium]